MSWGRRHSRAPGRSWTGPAVVTALAVVAVLLCVAALSRHTKSDDSGPALTSHTSSSGGAFDSLTAPGQGANDPTVVDIFGDSVTEGSDMNKGPTWATLLGTDHGWKFQNLAVGGSGYLIKGHDQRTILEVAQDALQTDAADLVIFAGGLNDAIQEVPSDKLAAALDTTFGQMKLSNPTTDVVILSPFPTPQIVSTAPRLARVGALLKAAADKYGYHYIDQQTLPDAMIGSDTIHPNDKGEKFIEDEIAGDLAAMGLPNQHAWQLPGAAASAPAA